MAQDITVGSILGELSDVVTGARQDVLLYTGALGLLTAIGVMAGLAQTGTSTISMGFAVNAGQSPASGLFDLIASIASVVATYLLIKRMLASRGQLRSQGNLFWPYIGLSILTVLGAIVGFILLIVPGIILLIRWSAATGFLIGAGERVTDSMSASWHATSGHSWAIFLAGLVLFLGFIIAAGVVVGVLSAISPMIGSVVSAFIESGASAVFAALGIAIYSQVSSGAQQLTDTFG